MDWVASRSQALFPNDGDLWGANLLEHSLAAGDPVRSAESPDALARLMPPLFFGCKACACASSLRPVASCLPHDVRLGAQQRLRPLHVARVVRWVRCTSELELRHAV